ncbi:rhodanese-like domain-containing protein [Alkalihalobacterium alkalinitrilicum]|uniref:rhodanese-like domain-containing protein n=1 Tax=Alkalihalobacterium alkalinitrilicum TaxID=427920 RepID=UPI0015D63803|nr:rhodanese-like domain-containing protein [Alkalihalobacterium alkalinitrilicum]
MILTIRNFLPAKGVKQLSNKEVKTIVSQKDIQLIDVRSALEYELNHIEGFKNIPLSKISKRHFELDREKEVVLICQSGMRSNKASKKLKRLGFTNITNIKGGMSSWS